MLMKVLFLVIFLVPFVKAQLQEGFYSSTCPRAEQIVRQVVQKRFSTDRSITAALLRMHFHDCFVTGCDASILIDSTQTKPSEKIAIPNQSVREFDLIDDIKKTLESKCQSTVSCADIITLATRDAVSLAGGPAYNVPTGRRDGLISDPNLVNLPGPTVSVPQSLQFFIAKNLTLNDMVALLGGHTVGVAHCGLFQDRLTNFQGTNMPDSSMDPALASKLSLLCGTQSRPLSSDLTTFLDQKTSFVVDNEFYNQIRSRRGVLKIDQELANDKSTAPLVARFASNSVAFRQSFVEAMVKMANIEVLVGTAGEIRNNCRVFNSPNNGTQNGNGNGNDKGKGKKKDNNDKGKGKGKGGGNGKGKGKGKGGGKGKGKGGGKGNSKTIKN